MKCFLKSLTIVLLFLLASSLASGQSLEADPRVRNALALVKVWLEAERAYQQIPGISAAIVYDQQVIWSDGFGYADVARKTPATPGTIYSVCSISKLFTSIAVMQLRDAGKLRLDDPVGRHLRWFTIKRSDPKAPEITIEGLLTHASGLPREAEFPYGTGPEFGFPSREEVIQRLSGQETLYPAETYFQYSNLGMTLAGETVAATSGQPYDEYVRRHILEPLGLRSTAPEMPEKERGGKLAIGYSAMRREGGRVPVPFFAARGIAPAAGYASTAEDLAHFACWQFRLLARKGGEDVLSANTLREMQRVHWVDPNFETTWGLGFSVWRNDNKTFVGHGGSCPGFRTQLLLKPDEKVAVIFMANAQGVDSDEFAQSAYDIIAHAIKAALKEGDEKARKQSPGLSAYTGCYESGFSGETAIVEWEDGLAAVRLPTMNPIKELTKLKKVGEHSFRRVRKDEALGETIVFEMGADGKATRLIWNSNHFRRTR
ncbi:MAG TPA: serine hydrolase domain-containing protein [Blastocatellia bacterium]|nr:serine hydrolase domain-containing protein [Blastocatellia bacterium]